jgi:hypothetical protein
MLITTLLFRHLDVAKFCIEKGASIDDDVEVAAWTALSLEAFKLLFPLDIFSWSQHRERLDNLLYDCFNRFPKSNIYTDGELPESEVKGLAEFLFEHGARARPDTAELVQSRWPALMPFLMSHISEEALKGGILYSVILHLIRFQPENQSEIDRLLTLSPSVDPESFLQFARNVETLKLLVAHGAHPTGARRLTDVAVRGDPDMITFLIDYGIPVNSLDTKGWYGQTEPLEAPFPNFGYALHYCVYMAHAEAVRTLLEAGADPNLRGKAGVTAFQIEVGYYSPKTKIEEVKRLLRLVKGKPVEEIPEIIRRDLEVNGKPVYE